MNATNRRKRLTDQGVERLKYDPKIAPQNGRLEITDELCPGLILRVTPKGAKSFSVIYKIQGEGGVTPAGRLLTGKQHRITLAGHEVMQPGPVCLDIALADFGLSLCGHANLPSDLVIDEIRLWGLVPSRISFATSCHWAEAFRKKVSRH